jgi:hypothetical protein
VIILPVFIALCCCCCVVFCGIICLSSIDTDELAGEEMFKAPEPEEVPNTEIFTGVYEPPAPVGVQTEVYTEGEGGGLAYGTFNNSSESNRDQFNLPIHGITSTSIAPPIPPPREKILSERFDID